MFAHSFIYMKLDFSIGSEKTFIDINVPSNFGLLFSGGTDSTLLAYILSNHLSPTPYHVFTVLRHNLDLGRCFEIIQWINKKTNNKLIGPIIVGNPKLEHDKQVLSGFLQIKKKYKIHQIFSGSTSNPYHLNHIGPVRIPSDPESGIIVPFEPIDKRYIIHYYKKHNLQELLDMTHSCGNDPKIVCEKCFSCLEKKWAIENIL